MGLGRTGSLWAHQQYGAACLPDIMTLAKPLAGGLPIGAALLTQQVADAMSPGDHGSTFAGNPLVCHAAEAAFDVINDAVFLKNVVDRGEQLREGLKKALKGVDAVLDVRGRGLISGVQLDRPAGNVCTLAREKHGLLVLTAGKGDVSSSSSSSSSSLASGLVRLRATVARSAVAAVSAAVAGASAGKGTVSIVAASDDDDDEDGDEEGER